MIVHETAFHQITVEFILQVPLRPSIIHSPYQINSVKGPQTQSVKIFIKHDNRLNLPNKRITNNN